MDVSSSSMLQFPGASGRVKLVDEVEVSGEQVTALLVVLSHSIAIVDAESNELLKSFDFQASDDHHTINDAIYVLSIRSFVVAFRDGSLTLIPPNCVDPKMLPRVMLKEPLCSLSAVGDDAVIGWTASGAVCELPVYAGKLPEDDSAPKKVSKEILKAAEESSRLGCFLRNSGVVTAESSQSGVVSYSYVQYSHLSSESLLASRPVQRWLQPVAREISAAQISTESCVQDGSWRVVSVCADPTAQGAVLLLLACSPASHEPPKSKKKSKEVASAAIELSHYLLKVDVATNGILLSRKLPSPPLEEGSPEQVGRKRSRSVSVDATSARPVHLLPAGSVVWIVWSSGVCTAFNSRHGVPVVLPLRSCTDAPTTARGQQTACALPTRCLEVLNHSSCRDELKLPEGASGEEATVLSIASEALLSDKNSFLVFALLSQPQGGKTVSLWHQVVSLFGGVGGNGSAVSGSGALDRNSSYKPTSLCAALGSLARDSDCTDTSTQSNDVSGGVLAVLPRTCKRRLNIAQSMLAEELNSSMYSNSNIDSVAAAPAAVVPKTPDPAKKSSKKSAETAPSTPAEPVGGGELSKDPSFQYIGMGRPKSATRAYLEKNIDAVEAFVGQLDRVLAVPDGVANLKSSDWAVLQAVLRTETFSLQKRPALLTLLFGLQRIDVLADIAQYVPDLSEGQALSILLFSIAVPESAAERYCLQHGRLKARGKTDTSFIKLSNAEEAVPATPADAERSAKKSSKKTKKGLDGHRDGNGEWKPSAHDVSSIVLSVFARALLNRSCAFAVPSLIAAARNLSNDAASIILSAFTSLVDGHLSSSANSETNSQLMDNFNDRQVTMALNWVEALLDSHYSSFAMALSNRNVNSDKQASAARVAATVLRKLFTMTVSAEQSLSELEAMFGLWTHVSRSARSGVSVSVGAASGALVMGGNAGALYQIETLEL